MLRVAGALQRYSPLEAYTQAIRPVIDLYSALARVYPDITDKEQKAMIAYKMGQLYKVIEPYFSLFAPGSAGLGALPLPENTSNPFDRHLARLQKEYLTGIQEK